MKPKTLVKFTDSILYGYGFDVQADRVVRFNKYPDGTYLNTRATYSINKNQFTHYDMRAKALASVETEDKPTKKKLFGWLIILALVLVVLSTCDISFTSRVDIIETTQAQN